MEVLRRKNEGWTSYQTRKIAKISVRRVNQVWKPYLETGEIPEIGKKNGRPPKPIEEWEKSLVHQAYQRYRVSASTLEKLIFRDYGKQMSHRRIHAILLALGHARKKPKKDIRKKDWIRYERRHSLTAVHIDWHAFKQRWVLGVIDDASRKMLSLVECSNPTTDKSIEGMQEALLHGKIK